MAELVGSRYASALYAVSLELNKEQIFKEELLGIIELLKAHPQFDQLLKSPQIHAQEKKDIIAKILQGRISQEVLNFLYILVDKRRQNHLQDIVQAYVAMVEEANNMVEAVAITAKPMEAAEIERLQAKLSMTSGKNITLKNEIDHKIMGGVLIQIGDKIIDGTVKNRLSQMKEQLSQIIV
ncbi:F0F1 ATP synthase subunit delta [Alkaliphilus crotonatoxidans]